MAKHFLSFEQQVEHLKNIKGLAIPDLEYAKAKLTQIGYFSLIGGYKGAFKNPYTGQYRDGTKFEDIVALYEFDKDLRELFLSYILQVERVIRSLLSYYFTEQYGESQSEYLDARNYTSNPKQRYNVHRLINALDYLAKKNSDYPYIVHQRNKHGNVPLWVLVGGITFGSLSIFYLLLPSAIRSRIAKHFPSVGEAQLEQFLSVLSKFRNVCAHGERLYSYKTRNPITDMPLHAKMKIAKRGNQYVYGKQDLFAVVISFRYLLPIAEFKTFRAGLAKAMRNYLNSTTALVEADLLKLIGFPPNWKNVTRYKVF